MKKVLLSVLALISMAPMMGQEAQVDKVSQGVMKELIAAQRPESFEQKLSAFQKAVTYLDKSRDCLSGIGCSSKQAYLANYLLGVAYGFATGSALHAFMSKNPDDAKEINRAAGLPSLIVEELGYRSFVKEEVRLWRCLTFRGCTAQTKRYLFFKLGRSFGNFAAIPFLSKAAREKVYRF